MSDPIERKKPAEHLVELRSLVVDYAKQETVDPLTSLKNYLLYGTMGALLLGLGGIFLSLGFLRMLQSLSWFEGDRGALSLIPYVSTLVFALILIGLALAFGQKRSSKKENHR